MCVLIISLSFLKFIFSDLNWLVYGFTAIWFSNYTLDVTSYGWNYILSIVPWLMFFYVCVSHTYLQRSLNEDMDYTMTEEGIV